VALEKSFLLVCATWYNGHLYHSYDLKISFENYLKHLYKNFCLNKEVCKRTTWIFLQHIRKTQRSQVQDKALRSFDILRAQDKIAGVLEGLENPSY